MKWLATILALVLAVALLCVDWSGSKVGPVNVLGSTSIQPFAEMLSQEFNGQSSDITVDVQGGGSTAGLQAAANGVADIGMCSRSLNSDEAKQFQAVVIARDGLAVVVHPSNPVRNLSREQIRQMFAGEGITNWRQVGGKDQPVRLITREEGSGTREAFTKLVMGKSRISRKALTQESNGSVKELVCNDPCAIGYMSLGLVGQDLAAVSVDEIMPTSEQVLAGRYPLVRPFLFVTKGPPKTKAQRFIDFVLSPAGQQLLEKEGLVRVR